MPANYDSNIKTQLRKLPSVDQLLEITEIKNLIESNSRNLVLTIIREQIAISRDSIKRGLQPPPIEKLVSDIENQASSEWDTWPYQVINGTGVIIHTNLGRAPLSEDSISTIQKVATNYSNLELDLNTGKRGSRNTSISTLICQITGSEAALAVNNNASAMMLTLATLASRKEVIVSRGESVEIGGGFRIPDVLRQNNVELIEVGTTNRTYISDYESAINESTGAILTVHASNFKVTGFTHSPSIHELVQLGDNTNIPVIHDLGSGCLIDTRDFDLEYEPMPQDSIKAKTSVTLFSGDKLLGGPQSGIIIGKKHFIDQIDKHPIARAVRLDKLSMAALNATLLHYVKDEVNEKIPVWKMISTPLAEIQSRACNWIDSLGENVDIEEGFSTIGGGSMPGQLINTTLVAIPGKKFGGAEKLAYELRKSCPPILGRIEKEKIILDPRTVLPEQDRILIESIKTILSS